MGLPSCSRRAVNGVRGPLTVYRASTLMRPVPLLGSAVQIEITYPAVVEVLVAVVVVLWLLLRKR